MRKDSRGLEVSTDSAAVIDAVDHFIAEIASSGDDAIAVLSAADAHPESALLNAYAAAVHMFGQDVAGAPGPAQNYVMRARAADRANEREALFIAAVDAWHRFDFAPGKAVLADLTSNWPRDVVAAKIAEFLFVVQPDYARHRAFFSAIAEPNADLSGFNAMLAFALDLDGDRTAAERVANRAIEQDGSAAWAHHALAHVYLAEGRVDEGLDVFSGFSPTWPGHDPGIQVHNWWHVALFHLANRDFDRVDAIRRAHFAGPGQESVFRYTDDISLLWRMEMAGGDVDPDVWREISPNVADLAGRRVFPFLNGHYVYALGRAGETAAAQGAIEHLTAETATLEEIDAHVWRSVGLPLLSACLAFAAGDYGGGRDLIAPVAGDLACVGGSEAQNDLFTQAYLVSLLETGEASAARDLLARRTNAARPTDLDRYWAARAL